MQQLMFGLILGILISQFFLLISFSSNLDNLFSFLPNNGSGDGGGGDDGNSNADGDDIVTAAHWLKYIRSYRYVAASPRYDIPYWMFPAKECGDTPGFAPFFQQSVMVRSRHMEDSIIYKTFFQEKLDTIGKDGTYIELGAYDGSTESNTHFFDKCLGWKGLLIEGNPENYNKVIQNRPFAHKMSFAPSCSAAYEQENHTVPFYRYPMTNVGMVGSAKTYEGRPTVDVPCGPLAPALKDIFGGKPILFFSLDVEGAEKMVLDTIDFKKVTIYVLMIEIKNNDCQTENCLVRKKVRAHMQKEGYTRYENFVLASDVYVHPESPYQIPPSVASPAVKIYE